MNIVKLIGGFKFKTLGKTDIGILKVAFMVAALDGEVTDEEYDLFGKLAKKCRGYTEKSAADALDDAMHAAGYLRLVAKRSSDAVLVREFMAEAKAALPDGFAYCAIEDIRRAVIMWIAMGMSDGDYSARERKCIEALRKHFAELKVMRVQQDNERWAALSPIYAQSVGKSKSVELVSRDFIHKVENLVAQFGNSAAASAELKAIVAEG